MSDIEKTDPYHYLIELPNWLLGGGETRRSSASDQRGSLPLEETLTIPPMVWGFYSLFVILVSARLRLGICFFHFSLFVGGTGSGPIYSSLAFVSGFGRMGVGRVEATHR